MKKHAQHTTTQVPVEPISIYNIAQFYAKVNTISMRNCYFWPYSTYFGDIC